MFDTIRINGTASATYVLKEKYMIWTCVLHQSDVDELDIDKLKNVA